MEQIINNPNSFHPNFTLANKFKEQKQFTAAFQFYMNSIDCTNDKDNVFSATINAVDCILKLDSFTLLAKRLLDELIKIDNTFTDRSEVWFYYIQIYQIMGLEAQKEQAKLKFEQTKRKLNNDS